MAEEKKGYSLWTAIGKSLKNNAVTLLPFITVVGIIGKDLHYAGHFWAGLGFSGLAYLFKNVYDFYKAKKE